MGGHSDTVQVGPFQLHLENRLMMATWGLDSSCFVWTGSDEGKQALGFLLDKWPCPFSDKGLQMELLPGFVLMALLQYTLIKTMLRCQQPTAWLDPEPTWVMGFLLVRCQNGKSSNIIHWVWAPSERLDFSLRGFLHRKGTNHTLQDWDHLEFCNFCVYICRCWQRISMFSMELSVLPADILCIHKEPKITKSSLLY